MFQVKKANTLHPEEVRISEEICKIVAVVN